MNSLPLATAGPAYPIPIGSFHTCFGPPAGNLSTSPVSRHTPSRFSPSHCGQSSDEATLVLTATTTRLQNRRMMPPGSYAKGRIHHRDHRDRRERTNEKVDSPVFLCGLCGESLF